MTITLNNCKEIKQGLGDLKQSSKITLVRFTSFGFVQVKHSRFRSITVDQGKILLEHKPTDSRKYLLELLNNRHLIILKGWQNIDVNGQYKLYASNGYTVKESICTAFDQTFLKEIALIWEQETLYSSIKL